MLAVDKLGAEVVDLYELDSQFYKFLDNPIKIYETRQLLVRFWQFSQNYAKYGLAVGEINEFLIERCLGLRKMENFSCKS